MKGYEATETDRRLVPLLPIYARIDGRSFSRFTKKFDRPYDMRMSECMIETAQYLVEQTHATVGYTQSDEISIVWLNNDPEQQIMFDGKIFKLTSTLAALATARFITRAMYYWEDHTLDHLPTFDARIFQLPNETEAMNAIYWRVQDARKNSISMAARSHFSHKELHGKSGREMIEMMNSINVKFDEYPLFFREGSFVKRIVEDRPLTVEEVARIPEHKRADLPELVRRSRVVRTTWPAMPLVANRVEVLFHNAAPILKDE